MKLCEIIEILEKIAPPALAAKWDNCGMQVAAHKQDIQSLALCLDPSPSSIKAATYLGAELIISHHPLLMQGRLPSVIDNFHQVLQLLFNNDTALYSAHTSLDINYMGPAGWLGRALKLHNMQVLEVTGEFITGQEAGFGLVGEFAKALSYEELLQVLQKHIDLSTATICGDTPNKIKRLAYCTGSGSSLMSVAHAHKADIFLTGDVKYHSALECNICTIDVGHHSLEEEMMRQLSIELKELLPEVQIHFVASTSPIRLAKA